MEIKYPMQILALKHFPHFLPDSSNRSSDLRLVVVSNGIAILPCESSEPAAGVEYTWTKDNEPVIIRRDGRIKITHGGHLLIKDTREEDSGVYVCETSGDNGAAEVNVTLIVLGELESLKEFIVGFSLS